MYIKTSFRSATGTVSLNDPVGHLPHLTLPRLSLQTALQWMAISLLETQELRSCLPRWVNWVFQEFQKSHGEIMNDSYVVQATASHPEISTSNPELWLTDPTCPGLGWISSSQLRDKAPW